MHKGFLNVENRGYPASYRVVVSVYEKALILNKLLKLRYRMSERSKQYCLTYENENNFRLFVTKRLNPF